MKDIIKKHFATFIIVGLLILLCNGLNVLHPYIVKQVVDIDFHLSNTKEKLLFLFICYLIVHILFAVFKNIRNILFNKWMAEVLKEIRKKIFQKVLKFKMKTYQKYNSSEIYTRLTVDTDNLFDLFFNFLQIIINNVTYIAFMVFMMFLADINLAFMGAGTVIIVASIAFHFTKRIKKINSKILDKRDEENKEFSEMYHKHKLTYLFGLQKDNIKKTDTLLEQELKFRKKHIFAESFVFPLELVLEALGIYAILYYALKINSSISLGNIYLVLFYVKKCRSPLSEMFDSLEEIQTSLNSLKRINSILKETDDEDILKGEDIKELNGDIEFKNVCMDYGKEPVLKDLSFVIPKGSKVTIAGKTGVGKTSLTNILMRLYEITSGQILIGGYDIAKISIQSLRNNISYISQNPYIFEDSLRNNITLGNASITDEEILAIMEKIGCMKFYQKFPKGLEEMIKESKLSLGELQIISFIRAIAHKANIYIFDEPTSNMDLKTEKLIQKLIDQISENSTVIIVAHRKSTLETSNRIIYLEEGRIGKIVNKEIERA